MMNHEINRVDVMAEKQACNRCGKLDENDLTYTALAGLICSRCIEQVSAQD
jgi:late competence protein required for DNA uptake (superfamily II DNA/RNA helicase)